MKQYQQKMMTKGLKASDIICFQKEMNNCTGEDFEYTSIKPEADDVVSDGILGLSHNSNKDEPTTFLGVLDKEGNFTENMFSFYFANNYDET